MQGVSKALIALALLTVLGIVLAIAFLSKAMQMPLAFSNDIASPKDRIKEDDIIVLNDRIVIAIPNAFLARFTDTNSMDPVLDAEANAIEIVPKSPEDIAVGDIIAYQADDGIIVHRVVEIGYDESGWYAITKGDNNAVVDGKVRFDAIRGIVVAIIY
jgi:signal peptidase I